MARKKLVIYGGSSASTPAFFPALAETPDLTFDEVCLLGRTPERVEAVGKFCQRVVEHLGIPTKVTWETNIRTAVAGAQVVLSVIRAGGAEWQANDGRILGDSGIVGHAGQYPRVIRTIPPMQGLLRATEELAPDAVFVIFTHPPVMLLEAVATNSPVACMGICNGSIANIVPGFASVLGVPKERVSVQYAAIDHLGWVTDVRVDGHSEMDRAIDSIIATRDQRYRYDLIKPFGVIPLSDAISLYRKGELTYPKQKGLGEKLKDGLNRYRTAMAKRPSAPTYDTDQIWDFIKAQRIEMLDFLRTKGSWYSPSVVPFLAALCSGRPHELIVMWKHGGQLPWLPDVFAESTAIVEGSRVRPIADPVTPPDFVRVWLRQLRESEHLLIRGAQRKSFEDVLQALAVHPLVASVERAERALRQYPDLFEQEGHSAG